MHSGKCGEGSERGADGALWFAEAEGSIGAALRESSDWTEERPLLERLLSGLVEEGLFSGRGGLRSWRRWDSWMVSLSRAVFYGRETIR